MEVAGILTGIAAAVMLAALWGLKRRRARRYDQMWAIPTFTDSMPREQAIEAVRLHQTMRDARAILDRVYDGRAGSRREMAKRGMPESRWREAMKLLRTLHVYAPGVSVPTVSERLALRRLRAWEERQVGRVSASKWYVANQ